MGFREDIERRASEQFRDQAERDGFVVEQRHRDGDTVQLWRCGKQNSTPFSFWVCNAPHCLMVYGDMGDFMWQRLPDTLSWARTAIRDLHYFSENVPNTIKIREEYSELIDEWFR